MAKATLGFLATISLLMVAAKESIKMGSMKFYRNQAAAFNISGLLLIAYVVIGAIVGMAILAALLPGFFTNTQSVVGTLSSATTGNSGADALMPTFGLLAAFAAVFAIIGLVIFVVKVRRS